MYKGAAKYTINFIPASTSPDLPSQWFHRVFLTGQNYMRLLMVLLILMGDNYLKTATSSSDFTFGTGDFTIEMFLYNRETNGRGLEQFSDSSGGLKPTSTNVVTDSQGCWSKWSI